MNGRLTARRARDGTDAGARGADADAEGDADARGGFKRSRTVDETRERHIRRLRGTVEVVSDRDDGVGGEKEDEEDDELEALPQDVIDAVLRKKSSDGDGESAYDAYEAHIGEKRRHRWDVAPKWRKKWRNIARNGVSERCTAQGRAV